MGAIYIIAGTSGSGKSTISARLQAKYTNIRRTVSITTRAPRAGERFGLDYFFVNLELFTWLDKTGQLLEYTTYDKNLYGTLKLSIEQLLLEGHDVLFNVDRFGIEIITKAYPHARCVFLRTDSQEEQHLRLTRRGMDGERITDRVKAAEEEISWAESQAIPIITTTPDVDRTMEEVEEVLFK